MPILNGESCLGDQLGPIDRQCAANRAGNLMKR
jgi:hypothetical protein